MFVRARRWLYPSLFAATMLVRLPTFTRRLFDPDEAAIAVQAMVVRSGGTLYADIFDRKPPLPAMVYAASFGLTDSLDIRPLRVLVAVAMAVAAILVAADARRRWGETAAWWAGGLFIAATMSLYPADAGAANFAHFALLPGTAALLWSRRGQLGWALAAGVGLGVAVLCRQSYLVATVPAAFSAWRSARSGPAGHVAALVAAAVLTVASTALYVPFGAFWEWTVGNSPGFVFAATDIAPAIGRGALATLGFVALHLTLVGGAAVALRRSWRSDLDLWLWVLGALVAVTAGLRFFGHYWLQLVPPLVVLCVPVLDSLSRRWRTAAIAGIAAPLTVSLGLLLIPGAFRDRPDPDAVAALVRANTAPGDRVFVWGSYPEVLLAADRLPAGRLVHSDFVTGRSGGRNDPDDTLGEATPGALETMLDDLRADPPAVIVDTSGSPDLGYRRYPMSLFPDLAALFVDHYRQVGEVDGITVWVERG
jgi:4-amino-4-deoxy-L-arabinose transferase-like glycosyltransferase